MASVQPSRTVRTARPQDGPGWAEAEPGITFNRILMDTLSCSYQDQVTGGLIGNRTRETGHTADAHGTKSKSTHGAAGRISTLPAGTVVEPIENTLSSRNYKMMVEVV